MRIMTWNIENGGAKNFKHPDASNIQNILRTIDEAAPDIVVIQEYENEFNDILVNVLRCFISQIFF